MNEYHRNDLNKDHDLMTLDDFILKMELYDDFVTVNDDDIYQDMVNSADSLLS